jgi:DNA-packaging protein gp3
MPAGRPSLFNSPEELQKTIDDYFEFCKPKIEDGQLLSFGDKVTITGLALYLGFESRQSFYDYERHEEFSYIIKRARLRVESEYEKNLQSKNPTGSIFALKNMGWQDKQEVDQKHSGGITINWQEPNIQHSEDKGSS